MNKELINILHCLQKTKHEAIRLNGCLSVAWGILDSAFSCADIDCVNCPLKITVNKTLYKQLVLDVHKIL